MHLRRTCIVLAMIATSTASAVEVVVHRGANEHAPENTFAAAAECIKLGVDYVEVDVRESADGVFYIMHDDDVSRTTDGEGFLHKMTASEIDKLDAGSWFAPEFAGEHVPRLETFLQWAKGHVKVYFDVKVANLQALINLVRATGFEEDCFFWFGADSRARQFRELAPDLPLKINAGTPDDVRKAKAEYDCQIIECGVRDVTPELKAVCKELNIKIMVRTGDKDEAVFRETIERGADMINLDHPDVFLNVARQLSP